MAMSKYQRKTIYFKADNIDLFQHLESLGKGASDYVCNLIRADLTNDNEPNDKELLNELKSLKEEVKGIRQDIKDAKIQPIQEVNKVEAFEQPEVDDEFGDLLL